MANQELADLLAKLESLGVNPADILKNRLHSENFKAKQAANEEARDVNEAFFTAARKAIIATAKEVAPTISDPVKGMRIYMDIGFNAEGKMRFSGFSVKTPRKLNIGDNGQTVKYGQRSVVVDGKKYVSASEACSALGVDVGEFSPLVALQTWCKFSNPKKDCQLLRDTPEGKAMGLKPSKD